nr:hypothetical protein CFP56_44392 [Quercus suber]
MRAVIVMVLRRLSTLPSSNSSGHQSSKDTRGRGRGFLDAAEDQTSPGVIRVQYNYNNMINVVLVPMIIIGERIGSLRHTYAV